MKKKDKEIQQAGKFAATISGAAKGLLKIPKKISKTETAFVQAMNELKSDFDALVGSEL